MKIILAVILGILLSLNGTDLNTFNLAPKMANTMKTAPAVTPVTASPALENPAPDDDPIVMHTRVKNTSMVDLEDVAVSLKRSGLSTPSYSGHTDSHGEITFPEVAVGAYQMKLEKTGYVTKYVELQLYANTNRTDTLVAE